MTSTEDSPDRPQYVNADLADLLDRHVRGEDVEWPGVVELEAIGAVGSAPLKSGRSAVRFRS